MTTALRPLSTSELLDRTFHLYRNHFMLFAGIAALPAGFQLVMGLLQVVVQRSLLTSTDPSAAVAAGLILLVLFVVLLIGTLAATVLANGATVYAVSMVHLEKPASITQSYKGILGIFWTLLGLTLLLSLITVVVLGVLGLPVLVAFFAGGRLSGAFFLTAGLAVMAAIPILLYLGARFSLCTPACVLEKLSPVAAMSRSTFLIQGHKWRIVLIIVLGVSITYALNAVLVLPATILVLMNKGVPSLPVLLWMQFGQFVATTLATPILNVALALAYYDERVRKEAFDLQLMMDSLAQPGPGQPSVATPTFG